jgi:type II secretory pathway pseudopilin PulG
MICGIRKIQRRQRGFILALLLALITVVGILLTKAMPSVVAEVQRDQEEELIFRGEAIRTAMRRYKAATGNYPTSLEALMKVRPRILRKLYKDPMTAEGDWDIVTAVQAGATGDTTGLPIAAIRSRSQKDSYKIYQGKTLYSEWVFAASDELLGISSGPVSVPPANLLPVQPTTSPLSGQPPTSPSPGQPPANPPPGQQPVSAPTGTP